jgi:DnaJ-class molecular chaperone
MATQPLFIRRYKYYEFLGIRKKATPEEIKQAFLKLARAFHPDVSQDPAANERFKEINHAYQILSDPVKRAEYDNGPTECPVCWTHEVIQSAETYWRCRRCGCRFDPTRTEGVIERVA